jgi:hypothetical protein
LIFLFIFITISSFGQTPKKSSDYRFILSPSISYQGQVFGELNLMRAGFLKGYDAPPAMWSYRVGLESNLNPKHFVIAPKIGYEVTFFLMLRGSILSYIDNGNIDLRILPEIGVGGYVFSLSVGYGIPLLNFRTPDVRSLRFSLVFNLDNIIFKESD